MKKITSILLVVLLVLTCLTMAACDPKNPSVPSNPFDTAGAQAALDLYIFEDDGLVISGEFVLPGNIGGFDATWTSSSDCVTLTEIPASEENGTPKQYAVKVGYPEAVTDVELTVSLSSDVTKTFTVIVNPISVHDFISAYTFDNDKNTVVADFDLDRTCEYAGKTATIDWSVDAEYADYLEISADGNTCIVYPTSLNPTVKINATFTYNGDSATKSYRMTVSEVKDHLQAVDYWYANTGVGMEMRGYVVEIATVYAPDYGNISLYIVDEDFCAGYYLYRVKCDQATADRLVPGAPVIVSGTTNTNYNGLIETNAGGTIVIDDEREAITEIPVYALDEEVVGGLFSANYHQSTLVSLTNWKVKEVKAAPAAGATSTLFILEKGGVQVSVAVSKYMEGAYKTAADDAVWSALAAHGIQVGDIVSVTGILGNYKGHQIMPLSIDGIVKGDTESTYTAGVTAAAAVKAIDKAIADNGLNNVVAVEKSVALPAVDGATITAKVLGASRAVTVVDGAIVIAPGKLENACVQFDITVGEFTNSIFRYIESADLDDAGKLAMELETFGADVTDSIKDDVTITLPNAGSIFSAINVTWDFKADTTHDCATLDGNALTVALPAEETTITLVATLSLGEATPVTKEFTMTVAAARTSFVKAAIKAAGEAGTTTEDSYIIIGTVSEITTAYSAQYGNVSFNVVDAEGNKLLVYRYNLDDAETLAVGDAVAFAAPIKNYNGTIEAVAPFTALDVMSLTDAAAAGLAGTGVDGTVVYGFVKSIDTAYSSQYNNITITISDGTNTFYCYRVAGGEDIVVGEYLLITGKPSSYNSAAQMGAGATYSRSNIYVAPETPGEGGETPEPAEKVTTIEAALAAAEGTAAEFSGTVSEIYQAWSDQYNNISFYVTDGTNAILVFRAGTKVNVGDVVSVVGSVTIYNSTAQIAQGATVTVTQAATPVEPTKVTTIADALKAAVGAEAELEGTVVGLGTWNTQYNNWDVTISDGTNLLLVYRCTNHDLGLGDVVSVVGTISAYNNVNQIAQGSTVIVVTAHVCTFDPADCDTPATCPVCEKTDGEALGHVDENPADGTCDRCQANLQQATSQVTASKTIAELITSEGWDSTTTKQTFNLDEKVTVAINGGSNTGKAYNGDHIRIYATDSPAGTITISVPEGYELVSVKITAQVGTYAFLYLGEGTTDICNVETAVSGQSVVLNSVKNGDNGKQVRVTAIEVVYRPVQA